MNFKTPRQKKEWESTRPHSNLRLVVADAVVMMHRLGWTPLVTSVWRSAAEERRLNSSGVHNAWRAIDIRTRDVDARLVDDLERYLNEAWIYDTARTRLPVAYAALHGDGPHIHIQVTDRTQRRGTERELRQDATRWPVEPR